MKTEEVCAKLGITYQRLNRLRNIHSIPVGKRGVRLEWPEDSLQKLARVLAAEKPRGRWPEGRSSLEVAELFGLRPDELWRIKRTHGIHVRKDGSHLVWDETAIAKVRAVLTAEKAREKEERALTKEGLPTMAVCRLLGLRYQHFEQIIQPLRGRLPVIRRGGFVLWPESSVAMLRQAVEYRRAAARKQHPQQAVAYREAIQRLRELKAELRRMAEEVDALGALLDRNPPAVPAFIHSLPDAGHALVTPVAVLISPTGSKAAPYRASLAELGLEGEGGDREDALLRLRDAFWERYLELQSSPESSPEQWQIFQGMIVRVHRRRPGRPPRSSGENVG